MWADEFRRYFLDWLLKHAVEERRTKMEGSQYEWHMLDQWLSFFEFVNLYISDKQCTILQELRNKDDKHVKNEVIPG